jgi:phosphohistidine phosphatase
MLRLMLLRHAKAERSRPGERDHSRTLADRGRRDAPTLGAYIARHGLTPDAALVSTAARTRETWDLVAGELKDLPPVTIDPRLYDAGPDDILAAVRDVSPKVDTLLVVGHNPGLHELAVMLVASGDHDLRQKLDEAFPTSALAVIGFAIKSWARLHPRAGRLERFVTPRLLANETN